MMNWNASSTCSNIWTKKPSGVLFVLLWVGICAALQAQSVPDSLRSAEPNPAPTPLIKPESEQSAKPLALPIKKRYPEPKRVMMRSLILPGWGQATNKHYWKIPIVYGGLVGLTLYSIDRTKRYHDYRAAFYNVASGNDDLRFGRTPDFLTDVTNASVLRFNRNRFRNQRDISYVFIGLFYGLNVLDAYIFAHLRTFDLSDDLSLSVGPGVEHIQGRAVPMFKTSIPIRIRPKRK